MENSVEYWKKFRKELTKNIIVTTDLEKTPENIYNMAKKIGVKPTARYFDIYPSTVRYHIKKFEGTKIK